MGNPESDKYGSDSDEEEKRSKRKRKHHKSSSRNHHDRKSRKEEQRRIHSSDESSAYSSSDSCARRKDRKRRKREKKHRKKAERREKKDKKKQSRKEEKKKSSKEEDDSDSSRLKRNYQLTDALQSLLEIQPGMSTELPFLLIRMADGTSFNLSQMPDARVSSRLQQVLVSLSPFGVERDESGSWSWNAPSGGKKDSLILLKIVRTLLDQIGITTEAVNDYEKGKDAVQAESRRKEMVAQQVTIALNEQTVSLLEQFQKGKDLAGPTLAQELANLCNMILSGESISLDGLPDEALRGAIENLFRTAGLEKSEMVDSDDEGKASDEDEPVMGYGLPEDTESRASANMACILEVCKARATKIATERAVKGPMMPPQGFTVADHMAEIEDDDEEGPAPAGSEKATKRVQKGPSLPPEIIKAMADHRKRELAAATGVDVAAQSGDGEREQWMLEPGEHDFLQGIKTGNAIKSRNFENKKKRPSAMEVAAVAPIDPSIQAEVDAIMELQREARGPSLMEQHRLKKAEENAKAAKEGKADWKWSRDKDLDAGRRVDKNALNMVMGGAAGNLKDKFQGGISRGFM